MSLYISRQKPAVDSDREQSDDEDEWTYPEGPRNSKGTPKKLKKEAAMPSAHKSGRGPGRPPKQHKEKGQPQSHGGGEVASNMADFHSIKVKTSLMVCVTNHMVDPLHSNIPVSKV